MSKTTGTRLRRAIEHSALSIRGFQETIDKRDVRGTSYAMIHRYLKDETEPPLGFIREASDILGVRVAWLATGQGEMSPEAEASDALQRTLAAERDQGADVHFDVKAVLDANPFLREVPIHVEMHFVDSWVGSTGYLSARSVFSGSGPGPMDDPVKLGNKLAEAMLAPLQVLGIDPKTKGKPFGLYCDAVLQALELALYTDKDFLFEGD